jgi:hypothetical protein
MPYQFNKAKEEEISMYKSKIVRLMALIAFAMGLFLVGDALAQQEQRDIKAILSRDVVKVENGMFSIQEFGILGTFDKNFEVKVTATAPNTLLSRDNFLRFYGALSSSIFSTYLSREGIKAPDDLHILLKDKPGDPIDITVNITMSEKGIDYTVVTKNSKSKTNLQWLTQLYVEVE